MTQQSAREAIAATSDDARLRALGSLIWRDRTLLLATATRARQSSGGIVVECGLRGASMASAIPPGARLRIRCGFAELRPGDVVALLLDERVIVHRIVYRRRRDPANAVVITRGDAMMLPDPPVAAPAVLGQVLEFDAGSGWLAVGSKAWTPRLGRVAGFALVATSAMLLELDVGLARRFTGALETLRDLRDRVFA